MNEYLALKNVSCGYGRNFNLQHISFSVKQGSLSGIIGPNGSGKTTLFRGITGELSINTGTVSINNCNLKGMPLKEKARQMAVVTQFVDVMDITVMEYVLMGRLPYRQHFRFFETEHDIEVAEKYMALTGVSRFRDKLMSQLSGGEQQLAGLARALAQEPNILLLDEPTSHLDITHQIQVLNLIQKLNTELKLTVLMIIHDLNLAGEYCDYLVLMNEGKVHHQGTPEEVLTYSNIEEVYKTVVFVQNNPMSNKPAIFLVSDKILEQVRSRYSTGV